MISPKQAGRFRAISRVHNWRSRKLGRLLALYKFSVEEITRDAYEELCTILVDAADDVLDGLVNGPRHATIY